MKTFYLLLFVFGFCQCGSTQFEKNPPFKIISATYTPWIGGIEGVSGKSVEITLFEKTTIAFDSLFFQNKKTKISIKNSQERSFLVGNFSNSSRLKNDLTLHLNASLELKNKLPKKTKFRFSLKENEAIISYKVGSLKKYYKIENIQKKSTAFFQ